jgi:hypothetical protein
MAIAALLFGVPTTPPDAPASGKKLFLNSEGKFAAIASDRTITPIGGGGLDAYPTRSDFPAVGLPDVLYVDENNVTAYNWTGTEYVQLQSSLDAGEY